MSLLFHEKRFISATGLALPSEILQGFAVFNALDINLNQTSDDMTPLKKKKLYMPHLVSPVQYKRVNHFLVTGHRHTQLQNFNKTG